MTSPEKIEELLNSFGETITDLPTPKNGCCVYPRDKLGDAFTRAVNWHKHEAGTFNALDCEDFICHQSDVIEKLVKALEKAYTYWEEQKKYYDRITCASLDKLQSGEGQK